jgi:hypothetical protein
MSHFSLRVEHAMKKILLIFAFIIVVGALAGPNKSNPSSSPHATATWSTGNSDRASNFMDDVNAKVISDAEREYQMASRSGSDVDRCVHAGIVAAAYLQAHNQPSYASWKMREGMDCHR